MSKVKELEKVPNSELSEEEKALIEEKRKIKQDLKNCGDAIKKVLEEYNCNLLVDMNSPMNAPNIILLHNSEKNR